MKKIFSFIAASLITIAATAQTVESSTLFENTYVTLAGGATTPLLNENWKPVIGVEFGKYITPVVGFSLEGSLKFGTLGTSTIVNQHNVVGNIKLNLSNWFAGYKGHPRIFEFVFVPGIGWGHVYGHYRTPSDPTIDVGNGVWTYPNDVNYLTYNVGFETNINVSPAFQINLKPSIICDNVSNVEGNQLTPLKENLKGILQIGVTYKFKSKTKNTHNFVLCPYMYTKADYDAIVAERDTLNKKYIELLEKHQNGRDTVFTREIITNEVVKEVPVVKEVEKETVVNKSHVLSSIITFPIGSSEVSDVEKAKLDVFARSAVRDGNITIVGSADSGTGSEEYNVELSTKRALAIKNILVNEYGFDANKIDISTALDTNENPNVSRSAILNFLVK